MSEQSPPLIMRKQHNTLYYKVIANWGGVGRNNMV